jgi:uncharacterized membrane protein
MAHKKITLAFFDSEEAADRAAGSVERSGLADHDAIGVLALDDKGHLKIDKVGARSTGAGVGIGAVLWLFGPVGMFAGLLGGSFFGALHHKGLGLDSGDKDRITKELQDGHSAVGVLTPAENADAVAAHLTAIGGTTEVHEASDEALEHAATEAPPA